MPHPVATEPTWIMLPGSIPAQYTRPLQGAELVHDVADRLDDGLGRCCIGVIFTTNLSNEELEDSAREGVGRIRFAVPIIASSIVPDVDNPLSSLFVYNALRGKDELTQWIADTLTIRTGPFDAEQFIAEMNQRPIPYKHSDGHEQPSHFYLLVGSNQRHGFFIHGPHSLLDVRPALRCLDAILGWIVDSPLEHIENLPWGDEWKRLPAPPIAATGGIRDDWDTSGVQVLQEIGELLMHPVPSHSLHPSRETIEEPGKMIHIEECFDQELSSRILKATKALGFSISTLFDSSLCLATFAMNPIRPEDINEANFTLDPTVIAQDRYLVSPHTEISHLVSGMTLVPLRVPYSQINYSGTARDALISVMSTLRTQLDHFLANPNLPHVFPAQLALSQPRRAEDISNPHISSTSNVGNVDGLISSKNDRIDRDPNEPFLKVEDIVIANRMPWKRIIFHCWSINSEIKMSLQASDVWDSDVMHEYLSRVKRTMLSILNDDDRRM